MKKNSMKSVHERTCVILIVFVSHGTKRTLQCEKFQLHSRKWNFVALSINLLIWSEFIKVQLEKAYANESNATSYSVDADLKAIILMTICLRHKMSIHEVISKLEHSNEIPFH